MASTKTKRQMLRSSASTGGSSGLLQIMWDENGNAKTTTVQASTVDTRSRYYKGNQYDSIIFLPQEQQQQQQKQQQLQQQQQQLQYEQQQQAFPMERISLSEIAEFSESTTTLWSYTIFLGSCLGVWLLYLLLPRGFRKQYCQAQRKRYARRTDKDMPAAGYWLPVKTLQSRSQDEGSNSGVLGAVPMSATATKQGNSNGSDLPFPGPPILQSSSSSMGNNDIQTTPPRRPSSRTDSDSTNSEPPSQLRRQNPPSPEHPALKRIPPDQIISETMNRLEGRGIRLVAHGVHCDPKRVWIRLETDTTSVTWQTEFPRRVPNQSGEVSIVLMRGSLHRIGLSNVLYIDVGRKTNALARLDPEAVPDATCFSLLTQNGSLDLQANSKLERDALVSCFSMILDDVHAEDWRALYEASPEPSLANVSNVGTSVSRSTPSSVQGTEVVYHPSDLMVEI